MFKWLLRKGNNDLELAEIKKLIAQTRKLKTNSLNIIDIRKSTIVTHFETVDDFLNSIREIESIMLKEDRIDKSRIAVLNTRVWDLENWLKFHSYKNAPVAQINQLILIQLIELINVLESVNLLKNNVLFSYYKRLNSVHFKEFYQWNKTLSLMLKYKHQV